MNLLKSFAVLFLVLSFVILGSQAAHSAPMTDAQRVHIDRFLQNNDLNEFGDPDGTVYLGSNPLFNEETGELTDRYEYLVQKFPGIFVNFVQTLPFDGVIDALGEVQVSAMQFTNDFDSTRLEDRFIDSVLAAEAEAQQLLDRVRSALNAGDFVAVEKMLEDMTVLNSEQLTQFGGVLKDLRRMLNGEFLTDMETQALILSLLEKVDTLEMRLNA